MEEAKEIRTCKSLNPSIKHKSKNSLPYERKLLVNPYKKNMRYFMYFFNFLLLKYKIVYSYSFSVLIFNVFFFQTKRIFKFCVERWKTIE